MANHTCSTREIGLLHGEDRMSYVQAGATYLDEVLPNWYSMIDLTKLDLKSSEFCILGQLEPHIPVPTDYDLYDEAIEEFDPDSDKYDIALVKLDIELDSSDLGFTMFGGDWNKLQEEWVEEINKRLSQ